MLVRNFLDWPGHAAAYLMRRVKERNFKNNDIMMPPKQEPSHDLHIHVFPENVSGQEDSIAKDF